MDKGIIEVAAKFSLLAFVYGLVKATIEIDDIVTRRGWGTHSIEVEPGSHVVQVSYPWLPYSRRAGQNQVTVEVAAHETVRVEYTARLLRYMPGKMQVSERFPAARVVNS